MLPQALFTSFIATLFSMTNLIGDLDVFASVSADRPRVEARRIALTCGVEVGSVGGQYARRSSPDGGSAPSPRSCHVRRWMLMCSRWA